MWHLLFQKWSWDRVLVQLVNAKSWVPYLTAQHTYTHARTERSQEPLPAGFFPEHSPCSPPNSPSGYCFHSGHFQQKILFPKSMWSSLKKVIHSVMVRNEPCCGNWTSRMLLETAAYNAILAVHLASWVIAAPNTHKLQMPSTRPAFHLSFHYEKKKQTNKYKPTLHT